MNKIKIFEFESVYKQLFVKLPDPFFPKVLYVIIYYLQQEQSLLIYVTVVWLNAC